MADRGLTGFSVALQARLMLDVGDGEPTQLAFGEGMSKVIHRGCVEAGLLATSLAPSVGPPFRPVGC